MINDPGLELIDPMMIADDGIFTDKLDVNELKKLQSDFPDSTFYLTQFEIDNGYYQFLKSKQSRRGEIVFGLENLKNQLLLHTKTQFPDNIYRLLSGGINANEALIPSLEREVYEETGFVYSDYTFLGAVFYILTHKQEKHPFISYIFNIRNISGEPVVLDKSENISGFKWIDRDTIINIYETLLTLSGDWKDWGKVRAYPHLLFN